MSSTQYRAQQTTKNVGFPGETGDAIQFIHSHEVLLASIS
jgi:hypothetical protein